jgi:hypothetical protein
MSYGPNGEVWEVFMVKSEYKKIDFIFELVKINRSKKSKQDKIIDAINMTSSDIDYLFLAFEMLIDTCVDDKVQINYNKTIN